MPDEDIVKWGVIGVVGFVAARSLGAFGQATQNVTAPIGALGGWMNGAADFADDAGETIASIPGGVADFGGDVVGGTADFGGDIVGGATNFVDNTVSGATGAVDDAVNSVTNWKFTGF